MTKENKLEVVVAVCSIGQKPYAYKFNLNGKDYHLKTMPYMNGTKFEIKTSHGICKNCYVNYMNQNGFIPNYKPIERLYIQ